MKVARRRVVYADPCPNEVERLLERARVAFPDAHDIRPVLTQGDLLAEVWHHPGYANVVRV